MFHLQAYFTMNDLFQPLCTSVKEESKVEVSAWNEKQRPEQLHLSLRTSVMLTDWLEADRDSGL